MKKENKVYITKVIEELNARDPNWWKSGSPMSCLKILYSGWIKAELRQGYHLRNYYHICWYRGWLNANDYERWREYVMQ